MDLEAQKKGGHRTLSTITTLNVDEITPQTINPLDRLAHNTHGKRPTNNPRHITEFRTLSIHVEDEKDAVSSASSHDKYLGKRKSTVIGEYPYAT